MSEGIFVEDDVHIVCGPEPVAPLSSETVGQQLYDVFRNLPRNSVAMIDGYTGETLLYSELLQKSISLATALRHYGYTTQKTVISISSENSLHFFFPVIASYFNDSIVAPVNHMYKPLELDHVLKISKPRLVFCSGNVAPKFVELKKTLRFIERIIVLDKCPISGAEAMEEFIRNASPGCEYLNVNKFQPAKGDISKTIAVILNSSGTTGLPKGVALTHQNINVRLAHSRDPRFNLQTDENFLSLMPFFHSFGLQMTTSALANGKTVIYLKKFEEDLFLNSIQRYKIKELYITPPLVVFLAKSEKVLKYDLSSIELLLSAGAPLSNSTEQTVKKRLKGIKEIQQAYGATETTLAITWIPINRPKFGSSGTVLPFVVGKVMDFESGKSLGPNQVGELCWKGPMVMSCYYENPRATEESYTPNGWLKTGDLGYYDEEGFFFVIDRIKELIKYKGYQVAPAEIEAVLLRHPKISDAGVVGVPDELVGERPMAFVVKKPGVEITEDDVQKYVTGLVSPQKRLSGGVIFSKSIPKNPSGKILRKHLREMSKQCTSRIVESKL